MDQEIEKPLTPAILAPAGNKASFLAAVAAGADAVYCGLKQFSARMEAQNFSLEDLRALTELAHEKGSRVYVAINTLIKPDELTRVGRLLDQLNRWVKPDALIVQDLSLVKLVRQAGFTGQLNLSTLANISSPLALKWLGQQFAVDRVVIPRELNIDEMKAMAAACPPGLDLEVFVHGALCYGVSGRCYWSSFLGGKSGLRGRCVQPCRRRYALGKQSRRFFSCQDLSLDVLVKVLMTIPQIKSWKIEGRKKGPHYVFYTVQAYQMLRDHGTDAQAKRAALELLDLALGRKGTHYHFLPQRPQNPLSGDGNTGSGLFAGSIQGGRQKPYLIPRIRLLSGDLLRIGYEDEPWHAVYKVGRSVPKKGRLVLKLSSRNAPRQGVSVFLIDRREETLKSMLAKFEEGMNKIPEAPIPPSRYRCNLSRRSIKNNVDVELYVYRQPVRTARKGRPGLWLSEETARIVSKKSVAGYWWCLPPVIWPQEEGDIKKRVDDIRKSGGRNFMVNAPWQMALFTSPKDLNIWAGPFCNLSNALSVSALSKSGFKGAIVSPELGREDFLQLPKNSPMPLGIVISGNWPLCISRILSEDLKTETMFNSPKGEQAWAKKYSSNYWIYPNWNLDIRAQKKELQKAGYSLFVHLIEPIPRGVALKERPGRWNWNLELL